MLYLKLIDCFTGLKLMATYTEAGLLDSPEYEPMAGLTRCMHFNAFTQCYNQGSFIPHSMNSRSVDVSSLDEVPSLSWEVA